MNADDNYCSKNFLNILTVTKLLAVNVVMYVGGIVYVRSVHQHKNHYVCNN